MYINEHSYAYEPWLNTRGQNRNQKMVGHLGTLGISDYHNMLGLVWTPHIGKKLLMCDRWPIKMIHFQPLRQRLEI